MWGLETLSSVSKHDKRTEEKTQGWAGMHISRRKGYIPRITASRHLIGRASLVISLARSISLWSGTRERRGELGGLHYANTASSALLHICKVGFQERQRPVEDREQVCIFLRKL